MYENIQAHRDPFQKCGDYDVWTDNSFLQSPDVCWDPSISGLDAIYATYPTATILLTVRSADAWVDSVKRWGTLLRRLRTCKKLWPDQPKRRLRLSDLRNYYLWQVQHVRDFAASHPSLTFVEVDLEADETASTLEERVGIPATCWGRHNVNIHIYDLGTMEETG